MRRPAARLCMILLCLSGLSVIHAAPASAAVPGFAVQVTEIPRAFAAGGGRETVTVVASQRAGGRCVKMRWSLVLRVTGLRLDQVGVERLEDSGTFPLTVQAEGDTARLTDVQLDPGTLCPGRTVTARYQVAVGDGAADGSVTFQAEAYDTGGRLLESSTVRRDVTSGGLRPTPDQPSPTPSESAAVGADDTAEGGATGEPSEAGVDDSGPNVQRNTTLPVGQNSGADSGLAKVGLVIGAIFIFLGVSLLLRLRRRGREPGEESTGRFAAYRRRRYS